MAAGTWGGARVGNGDVKDLFGVDATCGPARVGCAELPHTCARPHTHGVRVTRSLS